MINLFLIIIIIINSNLLNAEIPVKEVKLNFKIGKELYAKKDYKKAYVYFDQIIIQVRPFHKLSEKSKLYKMMINRKLRNYKVAITEMNYFINTHRYSHYIEETKLSYSALIYNNQKRKKSSLILKHFKRDINIIKKTLNLIQNVNTRKFEYDEKYYVINSTLYLISQIEQYNKSVMNYCLDRNDFLPVLGRFNYKFTFTRKDDVEIFKTIFLKIKCCNELFISYPGINIENEFRSNFEKLLQLKEE